MAKPLQHLFRLLVFSCLLTAVSALFAQVPAPAQSNNSPTPPEQQMQQVVKRLQEEYGQKANQITDYYVKSQQAYYAGDYQQAIAHLNKGLQIADNADLHAFRGAILFLTGQEVQAQQAFKKAFDMDNTLPIPQVDGLEVWLRNKKLMP